LEVFDLVFTLLSFLLVISISVLIHELGHFWAARLSGVRVNEFSLGMGPKVLSVERLGTQWSLRVVPIGGFVKLAGMEGDQTQGEDTFEGKGPLARAFILVSGALCNVLLAFALAAMVLHFHGVMDTSSTVIGETMEGYPAREAGISPGDRIVEVNGVRVGDWGSMAKTIRRHAPLGPLYLGIEREGTVIYKTVMIRKDDSGAYLLGVRPSLRRYTPLEALRGAYRYSVNLAFGIVKGILDWALGRNPVEVSGPVGIAVAAGDVARRGLWEFLAFLSALNLHLGLVNLLPFPALDGGRLIFVAFELVFRRRIPERYEGMIHYLGFAFLMALMVWITWRDVQRIVFGLR